jgi:hypothetical protein
MLMRNVGSINDATTSGSYVPMMAATAVSALDRSWIGIFDIRGEIWFPARTRAAGSLSEAVVEKI